MTVTDSKMVRDRNFKYLKLPWDAQVLGQWATDSQVRIWMSGDSRRTGTFYPMSTIAGCTTCSVIGVLDGWPDKFKDMYQISYFQNKKKWFGSSD